MLSIVGYILLGIVMNDLGMLKGWYLVVYIIGIVLDLLMSWLKYEIGDGDV